jgi:hypothetical protein
MKNLNAYYILLILVIVFLVGLIECHGQDSMYCMPIQRARIVAQHIVVKLHQDTVIRDLESRLLQKHLANLELREDFAAYRNNTEAIQAGDRSLVDLLEKNARHWQAEAVRRGRIWKIGRWGIPVGFLLGVLAAK